MGRRSTPFVDLVLTGLDSLNAIIRQKQRIMWQCAGCGHSHEMTEAELLDLREKVGGDFNLIGRRGRCPKKRCSGRTRFRYWNGRWIPMWTDADADRWFAIGEKPAASPPTTDRHSA